MPKVARSQEDREIIREKILDEALGLISESGFSSFSMRKLASRLGMTATTIYNYYSSKDELYLMILTKGFDMLYRRFDEIYRTGGDPSRKLREMVETYIDFGITNANYYNIMFTSDAPKYSDYIGTGIEPVAHFEKQTALKLVDIASGCSVIWERRMSGLSPQKRSGTSSSGSGAPCTASSRCTTAGSCKRWMKTPDRSSNRWRMIWWT